MLSGFELVPTWSIFHFLWRFQKMSDSWSLRVAIETQKNDLCFLKSFLCYKNSHLIKSTVSLKMPSAVLSSIKSSRREVYRLKIFASVWKHFISFGFLASIVWNFIRSLSPHSIVDERTDFCGKNIRVRNILSISLPFCYLDFHFRFDFHQIFFLWWTDLTTIFIFLDAKRILGSRCAPEAWKLNASSLKTCTQNVTQWAQLHPLLPYCWSAPSFSAGKEMRNFCECFSLHVPFSLAFIRSHKRTSKMEKKNHARHFSISWDWIQGRGSWCLSSGRERVREFLRFTHSLTLTLSHTLFLGVSFWRRIARDTQWVWKW